MTSDFRTKTVAISSILVIVALLTASTPSHAGILWTFKNEGNIDAFTTGTLNGAMSWDASGKLVATGDGNAQLTFFGETWDPFSGFTDSNNGDAPVYPPAEPHRLLTFRMQVTGGAATGHHLVVIYYDDTTGSYHGTDCYYRTGDQIIQLDLGATGFEGGTWDLSTAKITKVGFFLTYDQAIQQTVTFDWIALGDAAFTADVAPVWRQDFATEAEALAAYSGPMVPSWIDDGDGDGTLHYTYADPSPDAFDPFTFPNFDVYNGTDRPYFFCDLTANLNDANAAPLDEVNMCNLLSMDNLTGVMVIKPFSYYNGRQLVVVDPVHAAQANLPEGGGLVWGEPHWLDITQPPWTMLQLPDGPSLTGSWSASMYTDFDWWAQGTSCRFILEEQFSALDSDGDGYSDLEEILDLGTDPDDPEDPAVTPPPSGDLPVGGILTLGLLSIAALGFGVKALRKD